MGLEALVPSLLLAVLLAIVFGYTLGRLAIEWPLVRGLSNFFTELRGALVSFLVAIALYRHGWLEHWQAAGLYAGLTQAVAIARWMSRRSGEWSPAIVGGLALGRSAATLAAERARERGTVRGSITLTAVHLAIFWRLLPELVDAPPSLTTTSTTFPLIAAVGLTMLLLGIETLVDRQLRRRTK